MNNAYMIAPLQQVQSLENKLNEVETSLKDVVIPLLLDNWVEEENIFVQNITVDGLSGDIVPLITLSTVGEIATDDENYSYACISDVVVTEGNIKFIASEKPSISFTVVAKGVSANENDLVADVTALVGKVSELEGEIAELNSDLTKPRVIHKKYVTPATVNTLAYYDYPNGVTLTDFQIGSWIVKVGNFFYNSHSVGLDVVINNSTGQLGIMAKDSQFIGCDCYITFIRVDEVIH